MLCLALVVAVVAASYSWLGRIYAVPSGSMRPALEPGDRIVVSRLDRTDVRRGDVVVVDVGSTWAAAAVPSPRTVVKRVIGLPGERVTCCDAAGRLSIDGVVLDEPYAALDPSGPPFDVVVPAGRVWLMGDARADSTDSRHHLGSPGGGSVPVGAVQGRVVAVVWPPSRLSGVRDGSSAATGPRRAEPTPMAVSAASSM